MESGIPKMLRSGSRGRQPFSWHDRAELIEVSLEDRRAERLGALERAVGGIELPVPAEPEGSPPARSTQPLPPDPNAFGGTVEVVRGAWVAKYDPTRADREAAGPSDPSVDVSDVYYDYPWGSPTGALAEPWIHSHLMRGAPAAIPRMDFGDLVFAMRTNWNKGDNGWLKRRSIVGLWWVESQADLLYENSAGKTWWVTEVACFPLRLFDFPVPVEATSDFDRKFDQVRAFHDRSRMALVELNASEALAVVRACALPAKVLSEPNPDNLAPLLRNLDLGPPTTVRRRILEGAKASSHRSFVEKSARDVAVAQLRRARISVVSTEEKRGLGSDLWAKALNADGGAVELRVEVKGLSGASPWDARLTRSQVTAARKHAGGKEWWLVIVTRAEREDRHDLWLTAAEAAAVFTVTRDAGATYTADRAVAAALRSASRKGAAQHGGT